MAEKKRFSLAAQIGAAVGDASIAALDAQAASPEITPMSERTIENITSEILHYQAVGGDAVVQIGKRLIEAKAMLPHGGWLPWLSEQVNYSERTAQRLMKIARECSNPTALSDLGATKALALLALPTDERAELLEAYDVPNITTRELEDAIRERDEARKRAEALSEQVKTLESHNTDLETRALDYSNENDTLKARVKELESRPVDVAVQVDEKACQKAADEARRATVEEWQQKNSKLDDELKKTEEKLKEAREKLKQSKADAEAGKAAGEELDAARKAQEAAEAEAARLRAELDQVQKAAKPAAVSSDAEISEFKLYFGQAQENINKMRGLLLKVRGREDKTTGEKLTAALNALGDAVKEAAK